MQTQTEERKPVEEKRELMEVAPPNGGASGALATYDFGDDAGAGMENTRMEEQTTPFLRMAQGLSPELDRNKGEYIKGLVVGDIFNTATREFYDGREGVEGIFCWKDYHYGLWIPRDLGGGYRGAVPPEAPIVQQTLARMQAKYGTSAKFKFPRYRDGKWTDEPARSPEGEAVELVETGQIYELYAPVAGGGLTRGNFNRAIVAFTSTALPVYTGYVTRHLNQLWPQTNGKRSPAPIFAYRWRMTTFQQKNAKGEFYNWRIDLSPPGASFVEALYARDNPELFRAAKGFFDMAKAGLVKAEDPGARTDDDGPAYQPGGDDEVPL